MAFFYSEQNKREEFAMSHALNHDLNALKSLFLLYRERSVTKAARVAGVTQPSMSRTLNKLRSEYGDRLFVRQKDELVPTPKAELLVSSLAPLFEQIESAMDAVEPVQPAQATGKFAFCAPDFISLFAMANLPSGILTITPKIEFSYRYWGEDLEDQLKAGDVDLAFGYFPECPNHVKSLAINDDEFVFVRRPDHPLQGEISLADTLNYPHIAVKNSGFADDFFDRALAAKGLQRQRVVTTPDIEAAFSLLLKSDYLMVIPAGLARYLCPQALQTELPIDGQQTLQYSLYWGAIKDQDKLHQYIREVIKAAFLAHWPNNVVTEI